jgi:hypothetical protein
MIENVSEAASGKVHNRFFQYDRDPGRLGILLLRLRGEA